MEYINKIKKALCRELEELSGKNKYTTSDIEMLYKLTDIVKNLDKIVMLEGDEGYSEMRGGMIRPYMGGASYDDDMSYARGRGRNAKRDSMGRYSSDTDEYDHSYARNGRNDGRGYSRDDAKDHMMLMHKLGEMMEDADPKEREALKKCMRAIEEA